MARVRFRGRDIVMITFSDRNVVPGSNKYVDPGTCLTQQNQNVPMSLALNVSCSLHTAKELEARPKAQIAVSQSKAKQFLSALHRTKRNVWDRSRPDVQQWIQQFMNMGYDEAVSKTIITQMMSNSLYVNCHGAIKCSLPRRFILKRIEVH